MSERFHDLTKVPKQPAAKLLARAGMKLQIPIDAPASALPEVVLSELAAKAEKTCKGDACRCADADRQTFDLPREKKPSKPATVITVFIPTVQMGIDRACE